MTAHEEGARHHNGPQPRPAEPTIAAADDLTVIDVGGEKFAFVLPIVREDLPAAVREGLARRRITVLEGTCPCGATFRPPNRAERRRAARTGQLLRASVAHENGCPATDEAIITALRRPA